MAEENPSSCTCPDGFSPSPDGNGCIDVTTFPATLPQNPLFCGNVIADDLQRGIINYGSLNNLVWPLMTIPHDGGPYPLYAMTIIPSSGINYITGDSWSSLSPPVQAPNPVPIVNLGGGHGPVTSPDFLRPYPNPNPLGLPVNNSAPGTVASFPYPVYQSTISSGVLNYGQGLEVQPLNYTPLSLGDVFYAYLGSKGVWQYNPAPPSPYLTLQWAGFTVCLDISEETVYQIPVTANNASRIFIDGILAVELLQNDNYVQALAFVNVFEITLPAGLHTIRVEGFNFSATGGLSFDILQCTYAQFAAITTLPQLEGYRVFSTDWKRSRPLTLVANGTNVVTLSSGNTEFYDLGGYIDASPFPVFSKITQVISPTSYQFDQNIPAGTYTGNLRFLFTASSNPANNFTCEQGEFNTCGLPECIVTTQVPCLRYFTIEDCCCSVPYSDPSLIVFVYNGLDGTNPDLLLPLAITALYEPDQPEPWLTGCYKLVEIFDVPQDAEERPYEDYFDSATTVDSCQDCQQCISGYRLEDCLGQLPIIYFLSETPYQEGTVQIAGYPDVCWNLYIDNNICEVAEIVTIEKVFPDCIICATQFYKLTNCCDSEETIITGTDLSDSLGKHIKLQGRPLTCWLVEETEEFEGAVPVTKAANTEDFDTCLSCIPKLYKLSDCQEQEPDIFVTNDFSQYVGKVIKVDYCDICFIVEEIVCEETVKTVIFNEVFETCEDCLPPPIPPPPFELINRRIKPGYYTKGCPPEYTEKISCKFGDTMFDDVARVRYGIDICCDHDVQKWWIKKQLLNLKAIYDPALDHPVKKCCCYIIQQTALTTTFSYISCEGCLESVTVNEGEFAYICSQNYPRAKCPPIGATHLITIKGTACGTNDDCLPPPPPPIVCNCMIISNNTEAAAKISYYSCLSGTTEFIYVSSFNKYILCAQKESVQVVNSLNPAAVIIQTTTQDCTQDAEVCTDNIGYCHKISVTGNGESSTFKWLNLEGQYETTTLSSGNTEYICPQPNSVTTTNQIFGLITNLNKTCTIFSDCPPCVCYEVFCKQQGTIQYISCETGEEVTESLNQSTTYICIKDGTLMITSGNPTAFVITGGTELCETNADCEPIICQCVQLVNGSPEQAVISYYNCEAGETLTVNLAPDATLNLCAEVSSINIQGPPPGTVTIEVLFECNEALSCSENIGLCYNLTAIGDENLVTFTYINKDGYIQTIDLSSGQSANICAQAGTDAVTASNEFGIITDTGEPCVDDQKCLPCVCNRLVIVNTESPAVGTANIGYYCAGQTYSEIFNVGVRYVCSSIPITVNSADPGVEVTAYFLERIPCEPNTPCPIECSCYTFIVPAEVPPQTVVYYDCLTGNVLTQVFTPGSIYNVCSGFLPYFLNYPYPIQPSFYVTAECDGIQPCINPECVCWFIQNNSDTEIDYYITDCNGVVSELLTLAGQSSTNVCSLIQPFVVSDNPSIFINDLGPCGGSICENA